MDNSFVNGKLDTWAENLAVALRRQQCVGSWVSLETTARLGTSKRPKICTWQQAERMMNVEL